MIQIPRGATLRAGGNEKVITSAWLRRGAEQVHDVAGRATTERGRGHRPEPFHDDAAPAAKRAPVRLRLGRFRCTPDPGALLS
jgi:hypothetical protein